MEPEGEKKREVESANASPCISGRRHWKKKVIFEQRGRACCFFDDLSNLADTHNSVSFVLFFLCIREAPPT